MTGLEAYVGQVLDEKYRLECLLGQGGMGAVYLATHLGTERFVALKLIAPQFMRNEEFVERFKREARAAGRLRHPNVVDVTDFGFARADGNTVAYLVMEYLDGCTLGDVLAEEGRLPLDWAVDILEQVCSAVHEAHQQGIVHRDLKPDNIWLEPNRLGGYRVKVLDFGIAKLAAAGAPEGLESEGEAAAFGLTPTLMNAGGGEPQASLYVPHADSADLTADTLIQTADDLEPAAEADAVQTMLLEQGTPGGTSPAGRPRTTAGSAGGLTRVGAVMGTPLYMSPEQCRGLPLDARADIYSLGVIVYQMLAGEPPFAGDMLKVIEQHTGSTPPPPLRERNGKVPKRVARVVMSALEKEPDKRPPTAAAFANSLRANADGVGVLVRRAFALYSEHFPKFMRLSLIAHVPILLLLPFLLLFDAYEQTMPLALKLTGGLLLGLLQMATGFLSAAFIVGMTALMVTQLHLAPLRPLRLRTALAVLRRRLRPYLKTSLAVTLRIMLGYVLLVIPGLVMTVRYAVYGPVILLEGLEGKAARLRARALAGRSWRTVIALTALQLCIPAAIGAVTGALAGDRHANTNGHVVFSVRGLAGLIGPLVNIVIVPLTSITMALLYLKLRQMGGESMAETLAQFETVEPVRSRWQQRMRTRLTVNTPQHRT
ncbi:MAG: serine/threonine-protein kinase [Pyrinomonadaceae bacterium]